MVSPSHLEASLATKKTASPPSIGSSSKQPVSSISPISNHRLGTVAIMFPNCHATVEISGGDAAPSTPPARALPEHIINSEDNHHDSDSVYSSFSATHGLGAGGTNSDSTSSSVKATNYNGVLLCPKARAPKKTLGKHARADSNASSATSNGADIVPAKKRIRNSALMRSAPHATSAITPGGLAGNSEFMSVYSPPLPTCTKAQS